MNLVNIAFFSKGSQSSKSQWSKPWESQLVLRNNDTEFAIHTEKEESPWFQAEFPFQIQCHRIILHNRKNEKYCSVSNGISLYVSENGSDWELVYNAGKLFGWGKHALLINFDKGKRIKYVKIVNSNNYLHLSQIEILVDKNDNSSIELVTNRLDGLAQRLLGMLNAKVVAEYCGFNFRFTWVNNRESDVFHDVQRVDKTFHNTFVDQYFLDSVDDILCNANQKTLLYGGVYTTPQAEWIVSQNHEIDFSKVYDSFQFSNEIQEARLVARSVYASLARKYGDLAIIHIRAGDITYGPHRATQQFVDKVLQYPFVLDIIQKENGVLLVGQDIEMMRVIESCNDSVIVLQDYYPSAFSSIQRIFFDMEIMSCCNSLYGGDSGPISLAAKISGKKVINYHYGLPSKEKLNILRRYLLGDTSMVSLLPKKAVAFACSSYLYYGFNTEEIENLIQVNNLARSCDAENQLYELFDLLLQYRYHAPEIAENNVRKYIDKYGKDVEPLFKFYNLYNKNKMEFTNVSERVGYLNDLRQRVHKYGNMPYAELIIVMSEYCRGEVNSARKHFLTLKHKLPADTPRCLANFLLPF